MKNLILLLLLLALLSFSAQFFFFLRHSFQSPTPTQSRTAHAERITFALPPKWTVKFQRNHFAKGRSSGLQWSLTSDGDCQRREWTTGSAINHKGTGEERRGQLNEAAMEATRKLLFNLLQEQRAPLEQQGESPTPRDTPEVELTLIFGPAIDATYYHYQLSPAADELVHSLENDIRAAVAAKE